MNNNFFSYRIKKNESTLNNDNLVDLMDISPLRSYEIKIAKIPAMKNIYNKNLNLSIQLKQSNDNKNLLFNLHKLQNKNTNISSLGTPKKKINLLFFGDIHNQNILNGTYMLNRNKFKNEKINRKTLFKKLKKFHSCQNLILGRYPTGHRLLLPIQHNFKDENKNIIEEKDENKNKKEIYIYDDNIEKKSKKKPFKIKIKGKNKTKEKDTVDGSSQRKALKKEKEKEEIEKNKEKDDIGKEKEKEKDVIDREKEKEKEDKEGKKDKFKDKFEIFLKIKKTKKYNNNIDRCITSTKQNILDKVTRIHEYNDKIQKMNSYRFKKKNNETENELKEEKDKKNIVDINKNRSKEILDINKNKDILDLNKSETNIINNLHDNKNQNRRNSIEKNDFKSNSLSNIYENNIDKKQIFIKQINENNKEKKVEIKIINDNKEAITNTNIQQKETQIDNNEMNKEEDSKRTLKENTTTRRGFLTKDELLKRFVQTRKEYLEKEKKESLRKNTELYYLIFPGNASYLIKNCMNHRSNWKEAFSNVTLFYNFKWTELSSGLDYSSLGSFFNIKQLVNHFQNHSALTNKASMFFNLMNYCEKNKISIFKYVPLTIVYRIKDRSKYSDEIKEKKRKKNLENLKKFVEKADDYIQRYEEIGKYFLDEKFNEDRETPEEKKENYKKYSDMESNNELFSVENVENINEGEPYFYADIFQNMDKCIKDMKTDKNGKTEKIQKFQKIGMNTMVEIPLTHFTYRNIWVIKAINLNRGKCIKVVYNFDEMEKTIEKFRQGVNYNFTQQSLNEDENQKQDENNSDKKEEEENTYYCDNIIIQKYIENPLLYKGRKFDIRIWVLLTHKMKVYVFKEGHLKTCSVKYDITSNNSFGHITNYSFQKYNLNFEKYEIGNELPFYEFQKYIDEKYPHKNYKIKIDLMKQLKEIISLTMKSVKEKINKNNKENMFEIFGYDFMLDEDFNAFLIEINTNPGLEESSPWIKIIIPRMLDDALRLTLDQVFEPKYDFSLNYKNEENIKNYKMVLHKLKKDENPNSINSLSTKEFIEEITKSEKDNFEPSPNNENDKNNNDKKKKYISPFPVPGYELDENLWDFVEDLNEKELKESKENQQENESYTGIKHLLNKKNEKIKTEKT